MIEKELPAIGWGTNCFRPNLFGKEFDLQTDHQPIKWLQPKYTGKDTNPRLQRWLIARGEYDMKIEYIKGKHNKIADFLSRINVERNESNLTETENLSPCLQKTYQIEKTHETRNEINESLEMQTIHSQEENLNDHI